MQSVVDVVLPVFAIILCGYLVGAFRLLGVASTEALNAFVFYVALPVLLFHAVARVRPEEFLNGPFIAAFAAAIAITFALALALARLGFGRPPAEAGVFAMAATFGNTGYMGIPLALAAFGEASALPAAIAVIAGTVIILAGTIVLIEVAMARGGDSAQRPLRKAGQALVRNPLIVASVAGIAWSVGGVPLPTPVDTFCSILGAAAGPCALFAIGLFLVGKPVRADAGEVAAATVLKLFVMPAATWWLAFHVFDVTPAWATVAVMMAALPIGANVFVVAQGYGIWVQPSSTAVLVSTVCAVVTLSVLFSVPAYWIR